MHMKITVSYTAWVTNSVKNIYSNAKNATAVSDLCGVRNAIKDLYTIMTNNICKVKAHLCNF